MQPHKPNVNWVAITAIATAGLGVVALLALLFGQGLFDGQHPYSPTAVIPSVQVTAFATLPPTNTASLTPSPLTFEPNSLPSEGQTPIVINVGKSVQDLNVTIVINYVRFAGNKLLIDLTLTNTGLGSIDTCGLPKLKKAEYGEISPLLENGGLYAEIKEACGNLFGIQTLLQYRQGEEGWLVYSTDPQRFFLGGLYTLYALGGNLPPATFEVPY